MKIAFLTHMFSFGGATISLYLLNKQLARTSGIERKIYVVNIIDRSFVEKFEQTGAAVRQIHIKPIYNFQYGHVPMAHFLYYRNISYKSFIQQLEHDGIDILHINTTVFPHIAEQVRKYSKIRVVTHVRELLPKYRPGIIQQYIIGRIRRHSDCVIAISDQEAAYFRGHPNMRIIPNPVEHIGEASLVQDGPLKIGMVANMSEGKGHLLLIKAAALLRSMSDLPPMRFYIVGARPQFVEALRSGETGALNEFERRCLDELAALNLLNVFQVIAYSHEVAPIISEWSVFVRPSLSADPWGRDIIEAMSLGLPIVATGSSEFYVRPGENGFLVPDVRERPLAEAIARLVRDPGLREQCRKNNIKKIQSMCSMEAHGNAVIDVYKKLMN
ncbi:glycosyltransferase family 4 protein [Chitinophaga lutea]